ncbi:ECF-type riboflavin transporter substrate-binding protein [Fructilactobacillus frigidiflavus]|uniref:ECF-type riboflavin transporter substrate-binding protein n=1 Tax=Fructilactobacillus frigidiflavus TaxID=3242688 RepID=UPI003756E958
MKNLSVKNVVAIGIGSAIFVVLDRFASIPTGFPNTNLATTYAFLALFALIYGPVVGFSVGFIGHALNDFLMFGNPWWSWVICSALFGLVIGLAGKKFKVNEGIFGFKSILSFNVIQVIANFVIWALIAPTLDILIYSEPANKVYFQGILSATLDSISVAILGTILIKAYAATRVKKDSLHKE